MTDSEKLDKILQIVSHNPLSDAEIKLSNLAGIIIYMLRHVAHNLHDEDKIVEILHTCDEAFRRVVGDKCVNNLKRSVNLVSRLGDDN